MKDINNKHPLAAKMLRERGNALDGIDYDRGTGSLTVGGHKIADFHPVGMYSNHDNIELHDQFGGLVAEILKEINRK